VINTQAISSSSNKLGVYSKSGIPVIINDTFSTKKMFEETKWGEGIVKENELESKIDEISSNYDFYRNNAFNAFDKYYNLNLLSKELLHFLKN
jgi:triphosphoribosyl-dephospho-CoA synthetase